MGIQRRLVGALGLVCLVSYAVGQPVWSILKAGQSGSWTDLLIVAGVAGAPKLLCELAGIALVLMRPRNVLGWMFLILGAVHSYNFAQNYSRWPSDPAPEPTLWAFLMNHPLEAATFFGLPTVVLALYPDGRLPGKWWRWPVGAVIFGIVLLIGQPRHQRETYIAVVLLALIAPAILTIAIGTAIRWRRSVYPYRQQLAWYLTCSLVSAALTALAWTVPPYVLGSGVPREVLAADPLLLIPIGVAVGVLRYRLLGIRTLLRRGLVYGGLTVLVFLVHLLVTAFVGSVLRGSPQGVLAAAVVAVSLAPARDWLQRAADRAVYGAGHDPLRALVDLGDSVAGAEQRDLLPIAVASVAAAVHSPGAVLTAGERILARIGDPPVAGMCLPLRFAGAQVAELRIAELPAGEHYTVAEQRLLAALASQLAVVVRAVELGEALAAERSRVVNATRTERDRLRRDLHDSLGPSLTGMGYGLEALAEHLAGDRRSFGLVSRLHEEIGIAVGEVRRLIDGLRPSVLDTMTLDAAIRRHADTLAGVLSIDVSVDDLPTLTPEVETAAYRIAAEALTNAARHAGARWLCVTLTGTTDLRLTIADDGHGFAPGPGRSGSDAGGLGLISMRSRAESVGGSFSVMSSERGTTIAVILPSTDPKPPIDPFAGPPLGAPAPSGKSHATSSSAAHD